MTITPGLKFKSYSFAADAEVVSVRPDRNEADIKFTTTEGHAWIEPNKSLLRLRDAFTLGIHYEHKPLTNQFGFI
jgi:hypothetical protein